MSNKDRSKSKKNKKGGRVVTDGDTVGLRGIGHGQYRTTICRIIPHDLAVGQAHHTCPAIDCAIGQPAFVRGKHDGINPKSMLDQPQQKLSGFRVPNSDRTIA